MKGKKRSVATPINTKVAKGFIVTPIAGDIVKVYPKGKQHATYGEVKRIQISTCMDEDSYKFQSRQVVVLKKIEGELEMCDCDFFLTESKCLFE
jgi:hypothetical protein